MIDAKVITYNKDTQLFEYKFTNEIITGFEVLKQMVLLYLLTNKGSNLFNPEFGSNFLNLITESVYNELDFALLSTKLVSEIRNIELAIKKVQANDFDLYDNSQLLEKLDIFNIKLSDDKTKVTFDLLIKSKENEELLTF